MTNPNDTVRDAILRHLYEVHRRAKSPRSAGEGIRDVQRAMKESEGYKQQDVAANLDYLVQKGWVREEIEARSFQTQRGTTQMSEKVTYKISEIGIDLLEGASTFERTDLRPHVNITNVQGVTVLGDGNVVNTNFTDVLRGLDRLRVAVIESPELDDSARLNVVADIDTIVTQLQKPEPDKSIVRRAWEAIQVAVVAGEAAELAVKASELLRPLL
jgi:hypothetical protein